MQIDHIILTIAVSIITGLVISIVTAIVTVRLSLGQFRAERLWERRVDAYQTVLVALHRVSRDCKLEYTRQSSPKFAEDHKQSEAEEQKISDEYAEIFKAIDLGSFLLCDEAIDCLQSFETSVDKVIENSQESYLNYLGGLQGALDECLKELRVIAKKDLKMLRV